MRRLDMVEGRSKQAFKSWLAAGPQAWRDGVEVVAMDGFSGFKTATVEELPEAVADTDAFYVIRLVGNALDSCRRRVQQQLHGHRGREGGPLDAARRTLRAGAAFLTDRQQQRLDALFVDDRHAAVEVPWCIYQHMVDAYREPDRAAGRSDGRADQHRQRRRPLRAK